MHFLQWLSCTCVVLAFGCAQVAAAQDAGALPSAIPNSPSATAAPVPADDLVRLVSGDVYRGTIAESVRDSHVIIVTAAGDKRRFEWAEVAFAGAAEQAPPSRPSHTAEPAQPSGVAQPSGALPNAPLPHEALQIALQSDRMGMMWHARPEGGEAFHLCAAPCVAAIEPGRYQLGLTPDARTPVWSQSIWEPRSGQQLFGTFESARGLRIFGRVLLPVGLSIATGLFVAGIMDNDACSSSPAGGCTRSDEGTAMLISGIALGMGTVAAAIVLLTRKDSIHIVAQERAVTRP